MICTSYYTLSLHDALPISTTRREPCTPPRGGRAGQRDRSFSCGSHRCAGCAAISGERVDRKSTRLNSSHVAISYAVFCLKKKTKKKKLNKQKRIQEST